MKQKYLYFTLLILLSTNLCIGQISVDFSSLLLKEGLNKYNISLEQKTVIGNALTMQLEAYSKFGKLLNPDTRKIDRTSISSYKDLFSLDAIVINDLREVPESYLFPVEDYIEIARSYFSSEGVLFGLNSATITAIKYDAITERYTFTLEVSKTVDHYYTASGNVVVESKSYDLEFLYTLKLNALENIRIRMIRPLKGTLADVYTSLTGLDIGVGKYHNILTQPLLKGELVINDQFDYQIGFSYLSNIINRRNSPNKNLFISAAFHGFTRESVRNLSSYETDEIIDVHGENKDGSISLVDEVLRTGSNISIQESSTIRGIRGGIGLAWRLINKNTTSLFFQIHYVPTLQFSNEGVIDSDNSFGNYEISISGTEIDGFNFNSSELNSPDPEFTDAYEIGDHRPISGETIINSFETHGIRFSGLLYKDLLDDNPTYGLAIALHYYQPISNTALNESVIDDYSLYPINNISGVKSPLFSNIQLGYIGCSFSIYFKKSRQP